MFYNETKKKALAEHKKAVEKYNGVVVTLRAEGERLYQTRKRTIELIESIKDFLTSLPDMPHRFEPNVELIDIEHSKFRQTEEYAAAEFKKESDILGDGVSLAVAGGNTFARIAPDTVMWVATTFGKASTGTAISDLSGIAQNNAAWAWLGGGVLAKGGGGIAAGKARLALAGPIVFISTVAVTLTIAYVWKNKKIADQVIAEANKVTMAAEQLVETCADISRIYSETEALLCRVSEQFKSQEPLKDCNYADLSNEEQLQLESLVDNTRVMAELLNRVVG